VRWRGWKVVSAVGALQGSAIDGIAAFGLRRASAKACPGAATTRSDPFAASPKEPLEELRDQPASRRLGHPRAQQHFAFLNNLQDAAFSLKAARHRSMRRGRAAKSAMI
jgi:hypothetical protein